MTTTVQDAWAVVEIRYRVERPTGVEAVPLAALAFDGATIAGLTARIGETPVALSALEPGPRAVWSLPLDEAGAASTLDFSVRYRIAVGERAGAIVRVPVLAVTWPPPEAAPGVFRATLTLPPGRSPADGFPTGWRAQPEGSGTYVAELPVLPSLVSYRGADSAAAGSSRGSGLAAVLDAGFVFWGLFACLALIAVLYVVWMAATEPRVGARPGSDGSLP